MFFNVANQYYSSQISNAFKRAKKQPHSINSTTNIFFYVRPCLVYLLKGKTESNHGSCGHSGEESKHKPRQSQSVPLHAFYIKTVLTQEQV